MIEVFIRRPWDVDALEVLLVDRRGDGDYVFKPVEFAAEKIEAFVATEPTFRIPGRQAKAFLDSFAKAIEQVQGHGPESEAKLAGTLDATKYHLEDLRKLLKLNG